MALSSLCGGLVAARGGFGSFRFGSVLIAALRLGIFKDGDLLFASLQ